MQTLKEWSWMMKTSFGNRSSKDWERRGQLWQCGVSALHVYICAYTYICVFLGAWVGMCANVAWCWYVCVCVYIQCVRRLVCTFVVVSIHFSVCIFECFFCVCFCVYVCVYIFARLPQHQCVRQGVTPCQHSNSLTILPYPQVKQQAAEKKKRKSQCTSPITPPGYSVLINPSIVSTNNKTPW